MFTLKSYQDQVYNIGSPSPSPSEPPLECLPRNLENEFDFLKDSNPPEPSKAKTKSKLPVAPSRKSKRKTLDDSIDESISNKKTKMMSKDDFEKAMAKERAENKDSIDKVLASLGTVTATLGALSTQLHTFTVETTKNNAEVRNDISTITGQMTALQSSVDDTRTNFETKIVELEGSIKNLQKEVAESNTVTCEVIDTKLSGLDTPLLSHCNQPLMHPNKGV